ncbi:hypothetical protein CJF42_06665 [Pseudoalteromonas sp. NBT06-2]|uniref:hypothetical protein n=1 Tax=Pseudoalteromonas sp. NBT06-2 TaxID=2025950 RepID=UPI000BA64644|nr:hypothetical protein [Pseudoalteromonas sp. NBT06-2]PAJ75167.1 hypothetical protein CJF42_06665 [Pseudoalteromonas sp. NBT06-2]
MNTVMKTKTVICALSIGFLASVFSLSVNAQSALTLENLERERAAMLNTLTSDQITPKQQRMSMNSSYRRLTDVERMVLRDDRLLNVQSAVVQRAFQNYELTFLIHASAEKNLLPMELWLSELNITSNSILSTKKGRR